MIYTNEAENNSIVKPFYCTIPDNQRAGSFHNSKNLHLFNCVITKCKIYFLLDTPHFNILENPVKDA